MRFYYHQSAKYPFQGIIYDDLTLEEAMQYYRRLHLTCALELHLLEL